MREDKKSQGIPRELISWIFVLLIIILIILVLKALGLWELFGGGK